MWLMQEKTMWNAMQRTWWMNKYTFISLGQNNMLELCVYGLLFTSLHFYWGFQLVNPFCSWLWYKRWSLLSLKLEFVADGGCLGQEHLEVHDSKLHPSVFQVTEQLRYLWRWDWIQEVTVLPLSPLLCLCSLILPTNSCWPLAVCCAPCISLWGHRGIDWLNPHRCFLVVHRHQTDIAALSLGWIHTGDFFFLRFDWRWTFLFS